MAIITTIASLDNDRRQSVEVEALHAKVEESIRGLRRIHDDREREGLMPLFEIEAALRKYEKEQKGNKKP